MQTGTDAALPENHEGTCKKRAQANRRTILVLCVLSLIALSVVLVDLIGNNPRSEEDHADEAGSAHEGHDHDH